MNKKVIVVGAGVGGLVAAIKLAKLGYDIEIFEKSGMGEVSYPWYDDIRFDCFEISGITPPSKDIYTQKAKWSFISPDEKTKFAVPQGKPMEEVSIDRRKLSAYLLNLASEKCTIHYNTSAQSLFIEDNIIKGIIVKGETLRADLVIDSSGLSSVLKSQVPASYLIPSKVNIDKDIMHAYRAFFKRTEGSVSPDTDCNLFLKHLGIEGISWCNISPKNEVDVLIGRIGKKLNKEDVDNILKALRKSNPILSEEVLQESYVNIVVGHPLSVMVADNYVAIGDSAFMTMPLMGSGIESSMKAGKFLADAIETNNNISIDTLWHYQVEFFNKIGADYAFIDILKDWMLNLDNKLINWIFNKVLSANDFVLLNTDTGKSSGGKKKSDVVRKSLILLRHPKFVFYLVNCIFRGLNTYKIAKKIPKIYDINKIRKWQKKYENCFNK